MKAFETVQWSLTLMGYSSQERGISRQQIKHGFEAILIIILHFIYLFRVANTTEEYVHSIFMLVVIIGLFISFVSTAIKTVTIFDSFKRVEKIFNKGKVNVLLDKYIPSFLEILLLFL